MVVPILGMHRSGTSLTTRLLNLLGLHLGDDLQAAADDNQAGFWEHRFFQMINMQFLEGFGLNQISDLPNLKEIDKLLNNGEIPMENDIENK